MATPVKAITYLTGCGTQAPSLPSPAPLNVAGLLALTRRVAPLLWRPLVAPLGTQAPAGPAPQPLALSGLVARLMTLFWRGGTRKGWQIYPSGRNR